MHVLQFLMMWDAHGEMGNSSGDAFYSVLLALVLVVSCRFFFSKIRKIAAFFGDIRILNSEWTVKSA